MSWLFASSGQSIGASEFPSKDDKVSPPHTLYNRTLPRVSWGGMQRVFPALSVDQHITLGSVLRSRAPTQDQD